MPNEPSDFKKRIRFVIELGRALHGCGASSERIERHLNNTSTLLGFHGSFLVSPTTFTCSFWEDDEMDQIVHIERVHPGDYNLGLLWELDQLVERLEGEVISFDEAIPELKQLRESPSQHSFFMKGLSWLFTGGCFSLLISPNPLDAVTASLLALLIFLTLKPISSRPAWQPVATILGAMTSGLVAGTLAAASLPINPPLVVLSSIIIFIPGLALTVALTEISTGQLVSGSSRLVDAMMSMLKLFFGAASGIAITRLYFDRVPPLFARFEGLEDFPGWHLWPALVGLSASLGIGLNLPRHRFGWGFLSVLVAFLSATLTAGLIGPYAGIFLGALSLGLFANLFARITRGPASVLITTGVIVLVPGSKIYAILNEWVSGESIMPSESAATAMMALVSLTAGLLFANAFLPARKSL